MAPFRSAACSPTRIRGRRPFLAGRRGFFLLVIFANLSRILAAPPGTEDSPIVATSWQVDNGLPNNSVASLLQSTDGYLWLGTYDGLVRFDGREFEVIPLAPKISAAPEGISYLYEDRKRRLWAFTDLGRVFLLENGSLRLVGVEPRLGQNIRCAAGDSAGRVFAVGQDGLVISIEPGGIHEVRPDGVALVEDAMGEAWLQTSDAELRTLKESKWKVSNAWRKDRRGPVSAIARGCRGEVIIAHEHGLSSLSVGRAQELAIGPEFAGIGAIYPCPDGGVWVQQKRSFRRIMDGKWASPAVDAPVKWITTSAVDQESALWLGQLGSGVVRLTADGSVEYLCEGANLQSNRVSKLLVDREGSIWSGFFDAGFQQSRIRRVKKLAPPKEMGAQVATGIAEDLDGRMWIAGQGGKITSFDGASWEEISIGPAKSAISTRILFVNRAGELWGGTYGEGLWRRNGGAMERVLPNETGLKNPHAIYEDRLGHLWIGAEGGTFRFDGTDWKAFTAADGLGAPNVCCFAEAPDGAIWIGSSGGGIYRLLHDQVSSITQKNGLPTDAVTMLYFDHEANLWIGTRGGGLCRYRSGHIDTITTAQGLPDNAAFAMIEDKLGFCWITTLHGIFRIPEAELNACADGAIPRLDGIVFDKADGLATAQCMGGFQPALCQTADGVLWFPTSREIVRMDPSRLRLNRCAPLPMVQEISVNGKTQSATADLLSIPPGPERIAFRFVGLGLGVPGKVRYRYRLQGADKDWTYGSDSKSIEYSHLRPGKYRLELAARNEDGIWSDQPATISFQVLPFLWETLYFRAGAILGAMCCSALLARSMAASRMQRAIAEADQKRALETERTRIAQDIHDELGANLTRISLLSQKARTAPEDSTSVDLALTEIWTTTRELTRAMDEVVWAVNPRHDTIESFVTYVHRYAQRYLSSADIRCRFELPVEEDPRCLGARVRHQLFLAFKEALHNVVQHSGATEVCIKIDVNPQSLILSVHDNGKSTDSDGEKVTERKLWLQESRISTGNGLASMTTRLAEISGSFEFLPLQDGGACVRFVVSASGALYPAH